MRASASVTSRLSGHSSPKNPIGLAGGTNLYAYAGTDPITYSDPFGLSPIDWWDDIKRNVRRKVIEIGIRIWAGALGEEVKKIEPEEPTPVEAPAPDSKRKPGGKGKPGGPDPDHKDPLDRMRDWFNQPIPSWLPQLPPLLPQPGTTRSPMLPPPLPFPVFPVVP